MVKKKNFGCKKIRIVHVPHVQCRYKKYQPKHISVNIIFRIVENKYLQKNYFK